MTWPERFEAAARQERAIRNQLIALCEQIAMVEDDLATTLEEVARTATKERALRLVSLASAARMQAASERHLAQRYAQ